MKYLLPILLTLLIIACNQATDAPDTPATVVAEKPKDSELTLYMRHLEQQAKDWRELTVNGGSVAWDAEMMDSLFTATPTDGKIGDSLLYNNLGMAFKKEVQDLTNATRPNLNNHYNLMITACVNCHRNFCPGPIKRIEKLRIAE